MHPFGFRQAGRIGGSEDEWMCYRPSVLTMSVFINNGDIDEHSTKCGGFGGKSNTKF